MDVKQIDTSSPFYLQALSLRDAILRKPLNLSIYEENLSLEKLEIHFVVTQEKKVLGTVSLVPIYRENKGKLRQMATHETIRGMGFGKLLVKKLEEYAMNHSIHSIRLHARYHAIGFYKKIGYKIVSKPFEEVGIPHVAMEKALI